MKRRLFDEVHDDFRESVRGFLLREAVPRREEWEQAGVIDRAFWRRAAAQGYVGFSAPEEYGGAGIRDFRFNAVVDEEVVGTGTVGDGFSMSNDILAPYLTDLATPQQQERWLCPLLEGEIRSAFCMTEPAVASSDASNIATAITADGDEYVINGRKWWSSGAMNPGCEIFIVMGVTGGAAEGHGRHSMILVPREAPGITVKRGMTVFGYTDGTHGGHAEIIFDHVRVPKENLIAGEGTGFAIAQARLGPGRIHHCMRLIGAAERALELMCRRASSRTAFGKTLAEQGVIQDWIAESRVRIEQARLLVLKTAWLMDTVGNKGAHREIQAIKIVTPAMAEWVIDKAIQAHGAGGVSQDFPLAYLWASARSLRFADGPDEVHKRSLARRELRAHG